MDLDGLCSLAMENGASDLHVTVGLPPMLRIDGRLTPTNFEPLTPHDTQRLVYDILSDTQLEKFEQTRELDFSHGVKFVGRFRVNVFRQQDNLGAALRAIPSYIPTLEELNLPSILRDITSRGSGMILVTGYTGAGKSTTLAAMIDHINNSRPLHILTIEDPVEYLHEHKVAMVNQRELGSDTMSFAAALRSALREDPDVVLVGELRDLETIEAALTIAETGHLVFGTLHTRNATQTVDRIIDVFPPHQQEQVRVQLAGVLEAVIAQQLIPRMGMGGRIPALEIMLVTSAVRNLIREAKTHQMPSVIETSGELGMQTMDASLAELVHRGEISHEEALTRCIDPDNFQRLLLGKYT
ncbi:MAG: type IV pilus twitching motility protein PilT [Armatimonadota bacterium]